MNAYLGGDEEMNPAMKYSELRRPANTFVFIEEHENSRWESSFVVVLATAGFKAASTPETSWISIPADRHEQGCNLSFADGHAETWRWKDPYIKESQNMLRARFQADPGNSDALTPTSPNDRDLRKLQKTVPY